MSEIIKINIKDGDDIVRSIDFDKEELFIGRDPASDLIIDDIEVSRNHLSIRKDGDIYFVEDLKSTNGSFVNGKRVKQKAEIKSGDQITLGKSHVIEFLLEIIVDEPELTSEPDEVVAEDAELLDPEAGESVEEPQAELAVEPAEDKEVKEPEEKKKRPTWFVILLAALAFIVIFCVIPLIVIEVTNQWCDLFAGFFNSMSPGVCP